MAWLHIVHGSRPLCEAVLYGVFVLRRLEYESKQIVLIEKILSGFILLDGKWIVRRLPEAI